MTDKLVVTGIAGEPIQPDTSYRRMISEWRNAPKLKPIDPNDDPEFISRIKHTMKKGEKLMQWVARIGLSKAQVLAMSKDEISRRVAVREAQAVDDVVGPPELWEPKRPPKRFLLDTFAD